MVHRRDNYQQERKIGQGSFGVCFLVRDKHTGKTYAMKKIRVADAKVKESALQEAGLLRNLNHPFIVELHDVFYDEEQTHICMVMEYCAKGDLNKRIDDRTRITRPIPTRLQVTQIMMWFVQITYALYYCHDKKILHRDLKTENVFLTSNDIAQLGDFGIARELESSMEMAQTVVGTPYFMAPEVLRREPYSKAADIYSLGCILYHCLTGKYPYPARNMTELYSMLREGRDPRYMHAIRDTYPDGAQLYDILKQTLSMFSRRRPTARGLLQHPFVKKHIERMREEQGPWMAKYRKENPSFDEAAVMLRTTVSRPVRAADPRTRPASAAPAPGRVSSAYGTGHGIGPGFHARGMPVVAGHAMAIEGHRARPATADRKTPTPASERQRNLAMKRASLVKERRTRERRGTPGQKKPMQVQQPMELRPREHAAPVALPTADDIIEAKNLTPMRNHPKPAPRGETAPAADRVRPVPGSRSPGPRPHRREGHVSPTATELRPKAPASAPEVSREKPEPATTLEKPERTAVAEPAHEPEPEPEAPAETPSTPVFEPTEDSDSEGSDGSGTDAPEPSEPDDRQMAEAFITLQTILDLPEAVAEPPFPVPEDVSAPSVLRVLDEFVAGCGADGDDVITTLFMLYQGYRALLSLGQEPSPSAIATKAGLTLLSGPDPQPRLVGNPLLAVSRYYLSTLDLVPADPPSTPAAHGDYPCAVRGALACVARLAEGVVMRPGVDFIAEVRLAG
ncbi:Nek1 Ser/Thr kinase-like [Carpediemonas membranifera]|uniref:non-specific serine/threonine protein kinase n=1 Tax=Carpediemonas membranifera TaxID=201153 RepID=A0A8J6DZE8_9EUKA|nr:Nek1 Ser/Thr kinase-like [Carpediemonas membranifera]|eukprot:KAG9390311.1 Nek1 Ser/Thr kinase-like [Carpediemonas membranifera]